VPPLEMPEARQNFHSSFGIRHSIICQYPSLVTFCQCANNARIMASVSNSDVPRGVPRPIPVGPNDLPFFRFGLKQLFLGVAFLCILLAGMVIAKGIAALAVLMVALVIAAHVLSTALGSRLREAADSQRSVHPHHSSFVVSPSTVAPSRSPWHGRKCESLERLPLLIAAGVAIGGVGGGIFLAYAIGNRTSVAGIAIGALSLAVLGGWMAFLGSSFYAIFRDGLCDAISDQKTD
jgi:hypothetical protein